MMSKRLWRFRSCLGPGPALVSARSTRETRLRRALPMTRHRINVCNENQHHRSQQLLDSVSRDIHSFQHKQKGALIIEFSNYHRHLMTDSTQELVNKFSSNAHPSGPPTSSIHAKMPFDGDEFSNLDTINDPLDDTTDPRLTARHVTNATLPPTPRHSPLKSDIDRLRGSPMKTPRRHFRAPTDLRLNQNSNNETQVSLPISMSGFDEDFDPMGAFQHDVVRDTKKLGGYQSLLLLSTEKLTKELYFERERNELLQSEIDALRREKNDASRLKSDLDIFQKVNLDLRARNLTLEVQINKLQRENRTEALTRENKLLREKLLKYKNLYDDLQKEKSEKERILAGDLHDTHSPANAVDGPEMSGFQQNAHFEPGNEKPLWQSSLPNGRERQSAYSNMQASNQATPNQGMSNQGMQNQGMQNQGMQNQGMQNQGMQNQGMQNQAMSSQGMQNQAMPNQATQNQAAEEKPIAEDEAFLSHLKRIFEVLQPMIVKFLAIATNCHDESTENAAAKTPQDTPPPQQAQFVGESSVECVGRSDNNSNDSSIIPKSPKEKLREVPDHYAASRHAKEQKHHVRADFPDCKEHFAKLEHVLNSIRDDLRHSTLRSVDNNVPSCNCAGPKKSLVLETCAACSRAESFIRPRSESTPKDNDTQALMGKFLWNRTL